MFLNRRIIGRLIPFALVLVSVVCPAAGISTRVLIFAEMEPGNGAYISRAIANSRYLRLDYGDKSGFVLFDRQRREIYSINHFDHTVMVVSERKVLQKPPFKITLQDKHVATNKINYKNKELHHDQFFANDIRCADVFAIPDLLPDVTQAYQDYFQVLAGEHVQTLDAIPRDLLDACDLATNIFAPTRHFSHGFPIQEILFNGKRRILLDFDRDYPMGEKWYALPAAYRRFTPAQMRGTEFGA